ncbi:MAG: ABC transporter substrate-binding protein [Archangiaceae bacterium]|nr:ABC transporter substrate-binding protein [Archangiaceae bacterium]
MNVRALGVTCALVALAGCRIESAAPQVASACSTTKPAGDVWVYTSMYPHVLDALDPVLKAELPAVEVKWVQAGSEKLLNKLEAELQAGGTPADLLASSDPFLYARLKREQRFAPYVSPHALRAPRELVDADGAYAALRLSTMVLVYRRELTAPPRSFADLTDPRLRGEIAIGDPLTSGTAFTWAVFMEAAWGAEWFQKLRANEAQVAGGNAAVLQKLEGGEAKVGVLLLENALAAKAKGSPIEIQWPDDGAVVVPGFVGLFATSHNPLAAKAVEDVLLSPRGQAVIVAGDMHAVDPRQPGPRNERALEALMKSSRGWTEALLEHGEHDGAKIKNAFAKAFSK